MRLIPVSTALAFLSTGVLSLTVGPDPLRSIRIGAPDQSVFATFIRYGATVTDFQVKDKNGRLRDILVGFDDRTLYQSDVEGHPYFGATIGRYANRIRNGTFTIPISKNASGPNKFFVPRNEGNNTLHNGLIGYDRRPWTVDKVSANSLTLSLVDPSGTQGFPGTVKTTVTHTLESNGKWKISMKATADALTPIMLTGHHYWNLEAYEESQNLDKHFMEVPASRIVAADDSLIPNGQFTDISSTALDLRKAKALGPALPDTPGAVGIDFCYAFDNPALITPKPAVSFWSTNSGIKMDIFTNQIAVQVYTCNFVWSPDSPIPRKKSQGGPTKFYDNHSCVAIEPQSYIDAINNPEMGIDQIYGPARPYDWEATYAFSTI